MKELTHDQTELLVQMLNHRLVIERNQYKNMMDVGIDGPALEIQSKYIEELLNLISALLFND